MSANMPELIRMGALALLRWEARNQVQDTYRFFQEESFRSKILAGAPKPVAGGPGVALVLALLHRPTVTGEKKNEESHG
jgi:hypothetical protein